MLTAAEADKGEPGSAIMKLHVPAGLLAQLKADNLVNAERILLYDVIPAIRPILTPNMKRYLDILQQLSALTVSELSRTARAVFCRRRLGEGRRRQGHTPRSRLMPAPHAR